jgi:nucleoside 2-deoxyribosyltransferase
MRIYLAGPDVFLPDPAAAAAAKKALCVAYGAEGIFPTDPWPPSDLDVAEGAQSRAMSIYARNEAHMRDCDALIANLTPFRGPSADAGTVFELGFFRALARPLAGYSNVAQRFTPRTLASLGGHARRRPDGVWEDQDGMSLEDFDLHDNLMIDGGIALGGGVLVVREVPPAARFTDLVGFEACLRHLMRAA